MAESSAITSDGGYFYVDSEFPTGPISHNVTFGFNGYKQTIKYALFDTPNGLENWPSTAEYRFSIHDYNASNLKAFNWHNYELGKVKSNVSSNLNFILADTIKFNDQWIIMAGINRTTIDIKNYDTVTGDLADKYKKSDLTPTFSLIFKPIQNISTYVSYIESLEQGTIVGETYKNAGSILEPLKSEQYEVGVKAEFNNMLMTLAAFQIDKGLQYSDDNTRFGTYVQDGRQVHRGIEATLQGKLLDKLTMLGGFTLLDPKVKKTSNPLIRGKGPIFVPKVTASLYSEYDLDFIDGLTMTGGVYYVGKSPANVQNTLTMSPVTTLDFGLRYKANIFSTTATFLFNVTNITDKRYWTEMSLGSPRAFAFSAQFEF
jgi:iron complex outermembrane receptor protein